MVKRPSWGVIDDPMDVSDPRRHRQCSRSEHRHDVQIFGAILDYCPAKRERLGKRRIDDDLGRGFVRERHDGRCAAHLRALCATAADAAMSTDPANRPVIMILTVLLAPEPTNSWPQKFDI
jgi:hypothetical protein